MAKSETDIGLGALLTAFHKAEETPSPDLVDEILFDDRIEPAPPHSQDGRGDFGSEIPIAADAPPEIVKLKQRQQFVLENLINGSSISATAARCNVSRVTIHRWIKHDEAFRAAMRNWQERNLLSARGKLLSASEKAADVVMQKLSKGDLRAALAILKSNGVLDTQQVRKLQAAPRPAARTGGRVSQVLEMRLRDLLVTLSDAPAQNGPNGTVAWNPPAAAVPNDAPPQLAAPAEPAASQEPAVPAAEENG
jgi:transposase-like protein